ncbi:MAG: NUDIX domain-containing protein [Planctomycetota bacterium]
MEFVYVVKRYDLFQIDFPHGFLGHGEDPERVATYLRRVRERGFFIERRFAEQDSSFKQIIPYVVVTRRHEVLLLRRKKTQGEARLHDKLSIGIGGHINPEDGIEDVLRNGMLRELREELELSAEPPLEMMGVLNDDSNAVGAVHFGIVARVDASTIDLRIREQDLMEGQFVAVREAMRMLHDPGNGFETWSRLLLEKFDAFAG